jgi:hypothetical protein
VYGAALRKPQDYSEFLESVIADWVEPVAGAYLFANVPAGLAEARATLAIAIVRGLLLDLLATGDRGRVEAALREAGAILH